MFTVIAEGPAAPYHPGSPLQLPSLDSTLLQMVPQEIGHRVKGKECLLLPKTVSFTQYSVMRCYTVR